MRGPVEDEVLPGIRPSVEEQEHINHVVGLILEAALKLGGAEPMVVGSVARGTFIHGDRDIDIFLLFDPSLSREALEEEGLKLARNIAGSLGTGFQEKYAEHPYINATIDGLDVDLVPCFRVESAAAIRSAVDRTPFHTRYIESRIPPLVDDVLLLKQFAKSGGVYGSDLMTQGFSGYLCELLILAYGGFSELLAAAAAWKPGTLIDPEGHQAKDFSDPLIVIDPVDPCRNVAASLSLDRMFEFVELARGYRESPDRSFFSVPVSPVLSREDLLAVLTEKGTFLYMITLETPPYIPDVVVPQLRRSLESLKGLLERNGFPVNHADCAMSGAVCIFLFELGTGQVPCSRKHSGPPLWNQENSHRFFAKYISGSPHATLGGPYIENGRYIVEVQRRYTRADDLLRSPEVLSVGLGKHVRQSMEKTWELCQGSDCWSSQTAPIISRFFERKSPLARIRRMESHTGDR